ncbi:MAG TPA: hypothetical protein VFW86_04560, partial [Candidatus Limnocylindrales bacterium]|nr:hypothetical protein [Candidatus Limnocylindrales bacterium]
VSASVTPSLSPPASPAPASAAPSPSLSASPATAGQAIIHGVEVVGDPSYTADGTWLAFSAKPLDGSGGPYLYAWHAGDPEARQLTMAGMTYFAGWFGDWIVASEVRVDVAGPPASSRSASGAPQASGGPAGVSGWPSSFLLDPLTDARANLRVPGVWLPSIDPTGRFVTYWSGSLEPVFATDATAAEPSPALETSASGTAAAAASVPPSSGPLGSVGVPPIAGWQTGAGHLVLDGWDRPLALPSASPSGSATPELQGSPTASDGASLFPDGAFVPSFAAGPAGTQIELADGGITAFDVRFDPSGTRLATWVSDGGDSGVGRLWLTLLDRARGALRSTPDPLPAPGVESLRGFSLSSGRLGWVAPEGQDGQPSSVHVLAWTGDVFGQVQTVPGGSPQIVR